MKINLWYSKSMGQWRWTLADEYNTTIQESGQRKDLREAMNDVANTVEHVMNTQMLG